MDELYLVKDNKIIKIKKPKIDTKNLKPIKRYERPDYLKTELELETAYHIMECIDPEKVALADVFFSAARTMAYLVDPFCYEFEGVVALATDHEPDVLQEFMDLEPVIKSAIEIISHDEFNTESFFRLGGAVKDTHYLQCV